MRSYALERLIRSSLAGFLSLLPFFPQSAMAVQDNYHPLYIPHAGQICIERFEDEGLQNIAPVSVVLEGTMPASAPQLIFSLGGGQAACWWAEAPLAGSLRVRWVFSFLAAGDVGPETFSLPLAFRLAPDQTLEFEICQAASAQSGVVSWIIRRKGDKAQSQCLP